MSTNYPRYNDTDKYGLNDYQVSSSTENCRSSSETSVELRKREKIPLKICHCLNKLKSKFHIKTTHEKAILTKHACSLLRKVSNSQWDVENQGNPHPQRAGQRISRWPIAPSRPIARQTRYSDWTMLDATSENSLQSVYVNGSSDREWFEEKSRNSYDENERKKVLEKRLIGGSDVPVSIDQHSCKDSRAVSIPELLGCEKSSRDARRKVAEEQSVGPVASGESKYNRWWGTTSRRTGLNLQRSTNRIPRRRIQMVACRDTDDMSEPSTCKSREETKPKFFVRSPPSRLPTNQRVDENRRGRSNAPRKRFTESLFRPIDCADNLAEPVNTREKWHVCRSKDDRMECPNCDSSNFESIDRGDLAPEKYVGVKLARNTPWTRPARTQKTRGQYASPNSNFYSKSSGPLGGTRTMTNYFARSNPLVGGQNERQKAGYPREFCPDVSAKDRRATYRERWKKITDAYRKPARDFQGVSVSGRESRCCCGETLKMDSKYVAEKTKKSLQLSREASPRISGEQDPVKKLETFCEKVKAINRSDLQGKRVNNCSSQGDESRATANELSKDPTRRWPTDPRNLRVLKPRDSAGRTCLKKILVYPPLGENGPPLTLYKNFSNINCQVKGDMDDGYRYIVTYVQKFVSPVWYPYESGEEAPSQKKIEYECSTDYG